jgi:type I restriction enzyme, S subunit
VFFDPKDYRENLDKYRVVEGDLLIAMSGATTGKIGFNTEKTVFYLNQRVGKFEPKSVLEKRFLYYFLSTRVEENLRISAGAAQPNLSTKQIREFVIPLLPIREQQRIVGILDEALDCIATAKANAEKNLQNARALFASYLHGVFSQRGEGWEESALGKICDFSQGIQVDVKRQSATMERESQVRFLRIVDFTQGDEPERYIDNPGEKFVVGQSDVSLVRYGATTGFVCRGLDGVIANNLFRVIPKADQISNDFLYWFLKSATFQDEIRKTMNGAAMPAISFGTIKDIPFPFPHQREQDLIINKLRSVSTETKHLESIYQQKLTALDELKKSLLNQAFTGNL